MALCTWFTDFICGKKENAPIAGKEELKPEKETFCRSTRRNEWVERIPKDMRAIRANLIQIRLDDNRNRFRGMMTCSNTLKMWDTTTLTEITLEEIYDLGGRTGYYTASHIVEDRRARDLNAKILKDIAVGKGFVNNIQYSDWTHGDTQNTSLGEIHARFDYDPLRIIADFNQTKQFLVAITVDGRKLYRKLTDVVAQGFWGDATKHYTYHTPTGESYFLPNWVMVPRFHSHGRPVMVDKDFVECEVYDPIRITKLADGEDIGSEAYIYLTPGELNTYTRARYRIEVESERLFANKIVAIDPLLVSIAQRITNQGIKDKGKLFIDNIRYLRLDGSVHTADVGGFLTINAEPFRKGASHAIVKHDGHYHSNSTGPLIVSHVVFPTEPIY
jgi:hypothetical protein